MMLQQTTEVQHTLDKANLINELQCGQSVNLAIVQNRRADFALLLAMLSNDMRETTATEVIDPIHFTDAELRKHFALASPQPLRSDHETYASGAQVALQFHQGGIRSAKLQHYLRPDALSYFPEHTHQLEESVYHNLSGHQRRQLEDKTPSQSLNYELYNQLVTNRRLSQIQAQA
ncbi:VC2046/SO_2500 family protein [Vibrio rhizosphaerae]|uniref:VC2046/SO_2500 family protein n=2 Tax=Vibrio rhizosphaerae TaxID=398736 RepID=A0ABU4IVP9_9VIBR|nr:VC2046/SO_2500 family protein [Vibrio rhizosphaerae]MDW6093440.1 VC2046/SO_2500 family protein [Vibrio rhizosphaerae]